MAEWSVTVRIKLLHKLLSPIQQAPLLYVGAYIVMLLVLLPKFGICVWVLNIVPGEGVTLWWKWLSPSAINFASLGCHLVNSTHCVYSRGVWVVNFCWSGWESNWLFPLHWAIQLKKGWVCQLEDNHTVAKLLTIRGEMLSCTTAMELHRFNPPPLLLFFFSPPHPLR